ncbi:MAG: U32 family peptidase [Candidatus Bathyarchaeota archaeon]|nr:MAG: U32 family peptidase [Candidatus Bathyarchaeota archaeon]
MAGNHVEVGQKRVAIPKLMAPINSFRGGVKVVDAGADEVYCAVQIPEIKNFILYRGQSSEVSNYDELGKIVTYAHSHGVKVPLVVNWPYMIDRIEKPIKKHLNQCVAKDVDALIIGDFGVLSIAKDMNLDIPLYASTYMISMNSATVSFLENLGFTRVILERQLRLSEISNIVRHSNIEIEVLIHGGGCSNINGSCHLYHYHYYYNIEKLRRAMKKSLAGTPCTLKFDLYNLRAANEKYENVPVMDAFEYCCVCKLPELIKTSVNSLKIEGRTTTVWYQVATTRVYRELLDLLSKRRMKEFNKKIHEIKQGSPFFFPTPKNYWSQEELLCSHRRCYFGSFTHAPYKLPLSWQTWTKHRFKFVVQP